MECTYTSGEGHPLCTSCNNIIVDAPGDTCSSIPHYQRGLSQCCQPVTGCECENCTGNPGCDNCGADATNAGCPLCPETMSADGSPRWCDACLEKHRQIVGPHTFTSVEDQNTAEYYAYRYGTPAEQARQITLRYNPATDCMDELAF